MPDRKTLLLTGASRGIGHATVKRFSSAGWRVITCSRHPFPEDCPWEAGEEDHIQVDLADPNSTINAVEEIRRRLHGGKLEALVNNAGITRDGTMHRMTHEQWQAVIDTNLGSCFNCCRAVIDGMRERSFGRIVNIGSINGQAGQYGQVNYAAAKSGIHGFTKALAQEGAAKGITVKIRKSAG